ncbi:ROK family transcriptional regulator [Streptomyces sp. NPDC052015]|uniref:ROK family transcriptional regulator n=1 Tax=Streptomyces sp. NPDC052015 TaxID=3154755 RepID=UPI003424D003
MAGGTAGANLLAVRSHNTALVLDLLRTAGPDGISRLELAERTGLTPQAVSKITARLREEGFAAEAGRRASTGGKPRTVLRLVPGAAHALGVHLDRDELRVVLVELDGRVVAERRVPLDLGAGAEAVVGAVARETEELAGAVLNGPLGGVPTGPGDGAPGASDDGLLRASGGGVPGDPGDGLLSASGGGVSGDPDDGLLGASGGGAAGDRGVGPQTGSGGGLPGASGGGVAGDRGDGPLTGSGAEAPGHSGGDSPKESGGDSLKESGGDSPKGSGGGVPEESGEGVLRGFRTLLGVGVALPGPLDHVHGVLHRVTGFPEWDGFPLRDALARRLGVPVVVDKDTNAAALGLAVGGERGSFAYLHLGTGLGAGLVIGGSVHRGARTGAGEFGHQVLQLDGPPCPCGNRGCVEALCLAAIARGDVAEAARVLGTAAANLAGLLDIDLLLLGGRTVTATPAPFVHGVTAVLTARAHREGAPERAVPVRLAPGGARAVAEGAAQLLLGPVFGRGPG